MARLRVEVEDSEEELPNTGDVKVVAKTSAPRSLRETAREVKGFAAEREKKKKRVLLGKVGDHEGLMGRWDGKDEGGKGRGRKEKLKKMLELDEVEDCWGREKGGGTKNVPRIRSEEVGLERSDEEEGSDEVGDSRGETKARRKGQTGREGGEEMFRGLLPLPKMKIGSTRTKTAEKVAASMTTSDNDDVFGEPIRLKSKSRSTKAKVVKDVDEVDESEKENDARRNQFLLKPKLTTTKERKPKESKQSEVEGTPPATKQPRVAIKLPRKKELEGRYSREPEDSSVFRETRPPKSKKATAKPKIQDELTDSASEEEYTIRRPGRKATKPTKNIQLSPYGSIELGEDDDSFCQKWDDSDDMSDFIVNDSEVEESIIEAPPPKSARRLVRGRKPPSDDKSELEQMMRKLDMEESSPDPFEKPSHRSAKKNDSTSIRDVRDPSNLAQKEAIPKKVDEKSKHSSLTSLDVDLFTLRFSPSEKKVSKETRFITPPGSPLLKPRGLASPQKLQTIPSTPHAQHSDDFWSQDVVNDWNDEYSPKKGPKPVPASLFSKNMSVPEDTLLSPRKKSPVKQDRITKNAKKAFSDAKHGIAESFLIELDNEITNGEITKLAMLTGGVKIIWSKKLNTTAGRANWKRETVKSSTLVCADGKPLVTFRHHAAIELAEKVIDDEDRLLNVIAHEFCHLANFMISNIKTNPHGKEFKAWASKVSRKFGDRGIEVTTKHSYEIDYKYVWECENCGLEFKRHSKSIDPARHRCGSCKAKLLQTKPVPRNGVVTEYQVFVKENMKNIKKENPGSPQKEIMGLVGKRYQEFKANKAAGKAQENVLIEEADVISKENTPEVDDLESVSRKLTFLDLTSP